MAHSKSSEDIRVKVTLSKLEYYISRSKDVQAFVRHLDILLRNLYVKATWGLAFDEKEHPVEVPSLRDSLMFMEQDYEQDNNVHSATSPKDTQENSQSSSSIQKSEEVQP